MSSFVGDVGSYRKCPVCRVSINRKNTVELDIVCRAADSADVSSPASGRLTDHIAIGVLSGLIHRDIVDDVINECGKREKRSRLLPAHVVMYYVLVLNPFFGEAYEEAMRQLVNGLRFPGELAP